MAQGFVKSSNLVESNTGGLDRAILDNLGGPNISSDVLLLDGNTKFTAKLIASDYTVSGGIVFVNGSTSEGKVAFSNGTLLSHNGGAYQYTVRNSNGVDRFQLYTSGNVLFNPTGTLRRNDTVTGVHLSNLSRKRLVTDVGSSTGIGVGLGSADLFNQQSINGQVSYINGQIALFYYKRGRVPLTYQNSTFNLPIRFNGAFRITNDANLDTNLNTSPGLFIIDANSPGSSPIRAFSDTSNPWALASGALQTTETNAQCSVLKLQPTNPIVNINLDSTGNNHSVSQTNSVGSYTHKMPVLVNGQQYFLLLKL
jgi:hypothetical protein